MYAEPENMPLYEPRFDAYAGQLHIIAWIKKLYT